MSPDDRHEMEQLEGLAAELTEAGEVARAASARREIPDPAFAARLRAQLLGDLTQARAGADGCGPAGRGAAGRRAACRRIGPSVPPRTWPIGAAVTGSRPPAAASGPPVPRRIFWARLPRRPGSAGRPRSRWAPSAGARARFSRSQPRGPGVAPRRRAGRPAAPCRRPTSPRCARRCAGGCRPASCRRAGWPSDSRPRSRSPASCTAARCSSRSGRKRRRTWRSRPLSFEREFRARWRRARNCSTGDEIEVGAGGQATLAMGGSFVRLAPGSDVRLDSLDVEARRRRPARRPRLLPSLRRRRGDYTVVTGSVSWVAAGTAFDLDSPADGCRRSRKCVAWLSSTA